MQERLLLEVPHRGLAGVTRKVYEVDLLSCPRWQGEMPIIVFITD